MVSSNKLGVLERLKGCALRIRVQLGAAGLQLNKYLSLLLARNKIGPTYFCCRRWPSFQVDSLIVHCCYDNTTSIVQIHSWDKSPPCDGILTRLHPDTPNVPAICITDISETQRHTQHFSPAGRGPTSSDLVSLSSQT